MKYVQRLQRKIKVVRQQGIASSMRITIDRMALRLLRRLYGFNPWHAESPLSARPYRHTVADMVNSLQPDCVVEVGCGLGVTLSLVDARHRHGYDLDTGAIRAARLLRAHDIVFTRGDMSCVSETTIDVLVLVNWIHEFSPQQLTIWLQPLLPRTSYLLLDAIDTDNPLDYPFKHDFSFLDGQAELVSEARHANEGRRFLMYKVSS